MALQSYYLNSGVGTVKKNIQLNRFFFIICALLITILILFYFNKAY